MTPDTLNLAEAAEYLKLGYESTKLLFEAGELPGVSLNQKHTVFLRAELENFLRETARRQAAERRALPVRNPGTAPARAGKPAKRLPNLEPYEREASAA